MATVGEGAEPQRAEITKAGLAALVASSIEWYDFFICLTAAALVFPAVFFPESSAVAGVLASFSTAAVGFVARPIGGVLFGHFGDKLGRKPTLVIALVLIWARRRCSWASCRASQRSGYGRRYCSLCSASAKASPSEASGAARSCWRRSTLPLTGEACTEALPRRGFPSGSSSGTWSFLRSEQRPPRRSSWPGVGGYRFWWAFCSSGWRCTYSLGSKRRRRSGTWRSSRRATRPRNARQYSRSSRSI